MAAPVRFLSGRQQQQKIGIEGSTQNEKVLEVIGRVGIGTTVFDTTKTLDVRGDVEISGIISATRFLGDGSQLANLPASGVGATDNVNTSGIITASTFSGKGDFTNLSVSGLSTFSSLVDINANLDVTGHTELDNVNVSGVSTFQSDVHFGDSDKINMGDNDDLQIFHHSNGTGVIQNAGSGQLQIRSDEIRLLNQATDEDYAFFRDDGAVELYYDNSKKFETTGAGVTVFGNTETQTLNVTGVSTFVGLVTVTTGDVHIAQRLFVGGLEVEGTGSENTFTGINTFTNQQDNVLGNTNTGSLQGNGGLGIDKNASFGDKVFVQNAIGINSTAPIGKLDVNGHTELDDVNVSAALTAASLNVTNKLTTTGLGISVANGTGNTAYIEGPSEIWIDPAPAGAGTTSGLVRIRGDLYVDGTEFIVDVDKVQLSDYRIGIATTAGTNALLDGAGLGIGSESIEKTITWNNATSALMSSENWNLASGKHYEIAGTDVLTSTTLGGGVVNSSLTSVGTLGSLTVSGDITANGNIVGDNATNISNINQVTATTFSGALSGNATSATTATNVTVADESSDTTCNVLFTTAATGNLAPKSGTNLTFNSSNGTLTATEFSGGGAGITGLTASQVGAIADIVSDTTPQLGGNLDVNNKDITGTGNVNLTGIVTATNFVGGGAGLTGITAGQVGAITDLVSDTTPQLGGNLDLNSKLINGTGGINVTGIVTASLFDGNITGIATYTSEWIITSNGSSDYKFTGPGFDGTELDPTIYLVRGQEYKFTNNMGAHPFQIRTAINGSAYNDGISNNGVSNGTLTWDVQMDAPNVLYYQCTAHAGMVGKIYIGNSGDSVNVGTGVTINAGGINVTGVVTATSFVGNGAALTGLTANQVGAIGDVVSDTTPQLGGNLDLNSKTINGTGTINFTGNVTATAFAGSGANLTSLPVPTEVIVTDESSDTSCNVLFTTAATGNQAPKSGTNLTFNSSSGTLTATAFSGDGSALTNLPAATTIPVADESSDTECFLVFTTAATGNQAPKTGSNLTFNSSSGLLYATQFVGDGSSLTNVDAATLDSIDSTSFLRSDAADSKTSGDLTFNDGVKARFGTNGELNVYHESNASIILNSTVGDIIIRNEVDDADTVIQGDDGSGGNTPYFRADGSTGEAMLYHYGTEKLATKSGGVTVTGTLTATAFSGDGSALTNLPTTTPDKISENNTEVEVIDTGSDGHVKFTTEGSERARIDASGRLGIGTTNPGSTLEINVGTATSAFDIQGSAGQLFSVTNNLTSGSIFSVNDVSGIPSIDVDADGTVQLAPFGTTEMVGIGTTNPTSKLHVVGDARVTGVITATTFSGSGASLTAVDAATLDGVDSTSFLRSDAADVKTSGNLRFNDSISATFGTSDDLDIEHNGVHSYISNYSGSLILDQHVDDGSISLRSDNGSGGITEYIECVGSSGEVRLRHYGSQKFVTASTGIDVTGTITADGLDMEDDQKILLGNSDDVEIYYNQSNNKFRIDADCGLQFGINGEKSITAATNGNVELYYDDSKKLETTTSGVTVTGTLTATTFSGSGASLNNVDAATLDSIDSTSFLRSDAADSKTSGDLTFNDNIKARFGDSGDLEIFHDGSNSYIDDIGTGKLRIRGGEVAIQKPATNEDMLRAIEDGAVELYYDNSKKLETTGYGATVTGGLQVSGISTVGNNLNVGSELVVQQGDTSDIQHRSFYLNNLYSNDVARFAQAQGYPQVAVFANYFNNDTFGTEVSIIRSLSGDIGNNNGGGGSFDTPGRAIGGIKFGASVTNDIVQAGFFGAFVSESGTFSDTSKPTDFRFYTNPNGAVVPTEKVRITSEGNVGVGTTNPTSKLHVVGDARVTGVVTATSFSGDGSALTGISAGGSPEFYTGITSSRQIAPLSFETAVFTFPSTSGRQYVIESINVANVDESVGVGTTVNIIASIEDATAAEQTYIAYNVPIVTGGLIELLKNPIVAGPSDVIRMWTTNDDYIGVTNAADVYINYTEFESTDYISKFASSTTINSTDTITLYTSTGNPTMIEKIGFANRTDTGDFPVSIKITNGVTTSYLAKNLIIPRYSTVDILDRHKRIETGAKIEVEVGSTNTVDVIISGKKITS